MKNQTRPANCAARALSRRTFLYRAGLGISGAVVSSALPGNALRAATSVKRPRDLIGFTEFRTNLPGGRHANEITMRAWVVRADGTGHRLLAEQLVRKSNTWTQFAGWSPDGQQVIIGSGWESPENAAWEEEHKEFRFTPDGWLYDMFLLDWASGELTNVTAVERASFYNTGLFFWPKNPKRLGFQAIIGKDSHPFSMDLDGRHKKDLTVNSKEFAYGFNASPDGTQIVYHKSYQIYIAKADGSDAIKVETGQPFNFAPQWSPDGQRLMFVAGEHYNCHPHVVRRDGRLLHKLADRQGYRGVVTFLDVPDFHGGSSDVPIWSPDGKWIYYSAQVKDSVELMRVSLDRKIEQLTQTSTGHLNYHPKVSSDGKWLVFGSNRSGTRQLYVMNAAGGAVWPITGARPGWGSMWANWRPARIGLEN
ncbi:MAG: PD40 domain-containing protein [Verrucomicrobia bacterium]|nr:PD40 domain-containing protein [Verrucomicrobiota bacterium]